MTCCKSLLSWDVTRAEDFLWMGWFELIRDGKVIHTWPLDPANRDTLRLAATLPLPADKPTWYLLRAQADTPLGPNTPDPTLVPLAFTNPIWVGAPKP